MKVFRGKVESEKVVVEGLLPEGATVTVLAAEGEFFTLTSDEEAALLAAISEADRGDVVEAESVLKQMAAVRIERSAPGQGDTSRRAGDREGRPVVARES